VALITEGERMEGHVSPGEYKDVVLFLATAGVIVPLFRRWRISPILGFLGAGVVLGPYGLGSLNESFPWLSYFTIANPGEIAQLAEFGVVFLLFMIGLELSWERLRLMRRWVFGMGALQVGLCLAAIALAAMALGVQPTAAAAIGAALALSSTAVVMQILTEHKRQHSAAGRATFSVLLFQDLAVAPILVTLAILARGGDGEALSPRLLLAFAGGWGDDPGGLRPAAAAADAEVGGPGQKRRTLHGRLPAGGHRGGAGERPDRSFHGVGRVHRRAATGRDRVSP
jgi:monovalent cation:H+ antiporter-2, CPA2 family